MTFTKTGIRHCEIRRGHASRRHKSSEESQKNQNPITFYSLSELGLERIPSLFGLDGSIQQNLIFMNKTTSVVQDTL